MRATYAITKNALTHVGLAVLCIVLLLARAAKADEFAYQVNSSGQFGFINLTTGVFTPLGSLSVTIVSLGVYQGKLYGYGADSGTLYQINPTNGSLTKIGTAPFNYRGLGSTTTGLYGFDQSMNLYSISPTTGAVTLVGATGLSNPGGFGVSSGLQRLYITPTFSEGCCTRLYSVSTKTAAVTLIGNTGVYGIGALVVQDNTLYAGVFSPTAVYTLNPKTGAATFVANLSGPSGYFYGLAPLAQVAP